LSGRELEPPRTRIEAAHNHNSVGQPFLLLSQVPSVMLGNSAVKYLWLVVDVKLLAVYVTKGFMSRL
jgi:hypothetical protein